MQKYNFLFLLLSIFVVGNLRFGQRRVFRFRVNFAFLLKIKLLWVDFISVVYFNLQLILCLNRVFLVPIRLKRFFILNIFAFFLVIVFFL